MIMTKKRISLIVLLVLGMVGCTKKKEEDTIPPTVSLTGISTWQSTAATASVTCSDNVACDSSSKFKWLTSVSDCPTDYSSYTDSATISSHVYVCAAQKDTAGNASYTATAIEFKVDTTAPASLTITSDGLLYGTSYSKSSTTFTITNSATDADSSLSKICVKVNSTTCEISDFIDYTTSSTVDVLTAGAHSIYLTIKDEVGNSTQGSIAVFVQSWSDISSTSRPFTLDSSLSLMLSKGTKLYFWVASNHNFYSYDTSSDMWSTINGAPSMSGAASYTGFIYENNICLWSSSGACYNLTSSTWTAMPSANAPSNRYSFASALVGSKFCIWGGYDGNSAFLNNGSCFDVITNSWTAIAASPLSIRQRMSATATDTSMCIWGGNNGDGHQATGACYNLSTQTWTSISTTNAPVGLIDLALVYTGSKLCAWGGKDISDAHTNTGACYNLTSSTWTSISTTNAPTARSFQFGKPVWTGQEMCFWGGDTVDTVAGLSNGYCYDPSLDTWKTHSSSSSPGSRSYHEMTWTGTKMCIFGGSDMNPRSTILSTGACYSFTP
jgi:N-acetylneuraminic acid mutarotase